MKKLLKTIIRYKMRIIRMIIVLIFIFLLLIPAVVHMLTIDDGSYSADDDSNVPFVVDNEYIKNAKFDENGIHFEKEEQQEDGTIVKKILTPQDIWDDLTKANSCIEEYLHDADELAKLMNAQVITQFPYLPGLSSDKLNGTVTFERHKTDGSTVTLQYIKYDDYKKMVDEDNFDVLNKFTLDENNNLLIAIKDKSTEKITYNDPEMKLSEYSQTLKEEDKKGDNEYSNVTENITSRTINYQYAISKYVLPFQYLWSFLVTSDCKDFVMEFADLAYAKDGSNITISIFDNVTITENTEINEYKKKRRIDKYVALSVSPAGVIDKKTDRYWVAKDDPRYEGYDATETIDPENRKYKITHTSIYESNTPSFDVTYANVWIVEVKKSYESETKVNDPDPNVKNLEDTEYKEDENSPEAGSSDDGDAVNFKNEYQQELQNAINTSEAQQNAALASSAAATNTTATTVPHVEASVSVSTVTLNHFTKKIERVKTTKTKTTTQKYIKKNSEVREKTDPTSQEANFVTIFIKPIYANARSQILEILDWLLEMLENNPDTVNMIDLTKYLLFKATGNDYGVTEYDFSEYGENSFSNVGSLTFSGTIQEKVWFALKALGYTDEQVAGAMGNIHYESGGFTTVAVEGNGEGIGLCQWSFGRKAQLIAYAASKGVPWQDEDTQVEFLVAEISGGGPAAGFANLQFMTTGNMYGDPALSTSTAWSTATTVDDATKAFCYTFERPKVSEAAKSIGDRIAKAWEYYNMFAGQEAPPSAGGGSEITLTGENAEKMQQLISDAVRIANDDSHGYVYGAAHNGPGGWTTEPKNFDCSSFVGYLYYKAYGIYVGGSSQEIHDKWQGSKVSLSDLKPGDILWHSGHVAIYIGNGQIAEAQSSSAGIVVTTYKPSRFSEAYRIVK